MRSVLLTGLLLAVLSAGCSTGDDSVTSADYITQFYGKWQVTSGGENIRFMVMKAERRWHILGEDAYGFRGLQTGQFDASETQITFGGSVFTYLLVSGQLTLYNATDTIVTIRNDLAPDESSWVGTITPLDSIPAPVNQVSDITFDGTHLWYGSGISAGQLLYRVDPSTGAVVRTLPAPGFVPAVEWDGAALWCSSVSSSQLTRVTPDSGTVISTSTTIGGALYGIAWDGTYLWCSSRTADKILVYSPLGNSVVDQIPDVAGDGLAWANGILYVCRDGLLHRCVTTPFRSLTSYRFPTGTVSGVAFDGADLWVVAATGTSPNYSHKIYRVHL